MYEDKLFFSLSPFVLLVATYQHIVRKQIQLKFTLFDIANFISEYIWDMSGRFLVKAKMLI
jgi:hypothetical protein